MSDTNGTSLMQQRAQKAVRRFLKSVVVIDNEAEMGKEKAEDIHTIDIDTLSMAFSRNGLSCSVYSPKAETEEEKKLSSKLIRQNDVAIVDWQLGINGDRSRLCKETLKEALTLDEAEGNPPRLIVIYTGDTVDDHMPRDLQHALKGLDLDIIDNDDGEIGLTGKNLRIIFRMKKNPKDVFDESDLIISPDKLPEIVQKEYIKIANGILSIAALNAVSALRDKTNLLLSTFRKELDPSFILHSILVPHLDDSKDFLVNLLVEECGVILESDPEIRSCVDPEVLCEWLQKCNSSLYKHPDNNTEVPKDLIIGRIRGEKSEKDIEIFVGGKTETHKIYGRTEPERKNLLGFTRLCSLKRESECKYRALADDWVPELTQGSIVMDTENHYYLCVIPRCDSVRLKDKPAKFPFIKLRKLSGKHAQDAHLALINAGGEKCFAFLDRINWRELEMFTFSAEDQDAIKARKEEKKYYFVTSDGTRLEWIADLKENLATKLISDLAPGLSRIGIDEFEWQRRNRGIR